MVCCLWPLITFSPAGLIRCFISQVRKKYIDFVMSFVYDIILWPHDTEYILEIYNTILSAQILSPHRSVKTEPNRWNVFNLATLKRGRGGVWSQMACRLSVNDLEGFALFPLFECRSGYKPWSTKVTLAVSFIIGTKRLYCMHTTLKGTLSLLFWSGMKRAVMIKPGHGQYFENYPEMLQHAQSKVQALLTAA